MKNFIVILIILGSFYAGYALHAKNGDVFKIKKISDSLNKQDSPSEAELLLGKIISVQQTQDEKVNPSDKITSTISYNKTAIITVPTSLESSVYKFIDYSNVRVYDTGFAKDPSFSARTNIYPKAFINEKSILAIQEDHADLPDTELNPGVLLITDTTGKVTKTLKTLDRGETVGETSFSDDVLTIEIEKNGKVVSILKLNTKTLSLQ